MANAIKEYVKALAPTRLVVSSFAVVAVAAFGAGGFANNLLGTPAQVSANTDTLNVVKEMARSNTAEIAQIQDGMDAQFAAQNAKLDLILCIIGAENEGRSSIRCGSGGQDD